MIHLVLDFFCPLAHALDNSARTPATVIFDAPRSAASHAFGQANCCDYAYQSENVTEQR
jgi:hypothetical protein